MFFAIRVNNALALLGIDPRIFQSEYRQFGQQIGKESGATPQEVALVLASHLPMVYRLNANPLTAKDWIRKRKVNPRDPSVREALMDLGWWELTDY